VNAPIASFEFEVVPETRLRASLRSITLVAAGRLLAAIVGRPQKTSSAVPPQRFSQRRRPATAMEISSFKSRCSTYYKAISRFDRWSLSEISEMANFANNPNKSVLRREKSVQDMGSNIKQHGVLACRQKYTMEPRFCVAKSAFCRIDSISCAPMQRATQMHRLEESEHPSPLSGSLN
jgi:hypothetical protein